MDKASFEFVDLLPALLLKNRISFKERKVLVSK